MQSPVLKRLLLAVPVVAVSALLAGCPRQSGTGTGGTTASTSNRVVIYCSVDDVFSKPILDELEKETGLDIQPLFDVESAKAAGLANKIRAERNRPRADVFWASTVLQTQLLANEGYLASYESPSAKDIPAEYKDPNGLWTGMGLRARVLISSQPSTEKNLLFVPKNMSGKFAISNPQFGTCSDWVAAYGARLGIDKTADTFKQMKAEGVRILPGNADVALGVADGNLLYGVTDSDDYLSQKLQKKTVYLVKTTENNVLIPGCASMIKDSPNPENARKLLDALLSAQTEGRLTTKMPGVFSVRHLSDAKNWQSGGEDFSFLKNEALPDFTKWRPAWESLRKPLADLFTP
ncbi:extracellular solute-binding protein [bacterium]|nr:MAG: extracellular solute-binding protein [bacterium]